MFKRLTDFMPSPYPRVNKTPFTKEDIIGRNFNWEDLDAQRKDAEVRTTSTRNAFNEGEHWTLAGATGSGKTTFCKELLEQYRRRFPNAHRYVLNSTADPNLEDVVGARNHFGQSHPPTPSSAYTTVWTPDTDDMSLYNSWLLSILYARKPAFVLLDDIASLVGYGRTISVLDGHMKLMKQGRKHGITVVNGTQEMTRVPLMMFRQMTHFVQLRLSSDPTDLSYARKYLNITKEEQRAPRGDYGFFYKRVGVKFPYEEYESYTQFFHKGKAR